MIQYLGNASFDLRIQVPKLPKVAHVSLDYNVTNGLKILGDCGWMLDGTVPTSTPRGCLGLGLGIKLSEAARVDSECSNPCPTIATRSLHLSFISSPYESCLQNYLLSCFVFLDSEPIHCKTMRLLPTCLWVAIICSAGALSPLTGTSHDLAAAVVEKRATCTPGRQPL